MEDDAPAVRQVAVVVNARSGTRQAEQRRAELAEAFARLDAAVEFVDVADAAGLRALLAEHRLPRCDAVVAAGGDGTVNTVANALAAAARPGRSRPAPPLGVIGFGTFNYVARRYGLPEAVDEAVRTVVVGRSVSIAAGEVSGQLFLNNCSLGLYTSIIDARERHKAMFGRSRLVALVSAVGTLLGGHARPLVRIAQDGRQRMLRASLVFVGANPLQLGEIDPVVAQQVEEGALALVTVRAVDLRRLLGFSWRALTGAVVDAPEVEAEAVHAVTLSLRKRHVRVVVDGELLDLPTPLEVRWRPDALRLRVPVETADVDAEALAPTLARGALPA